MVPLGNLAYLAGQAIDSRAAPSMSLPGSGAANDSQIGHLRQVLDDPRRALHSN